MSESNYKPDGSGVVMGDSKPMPNRGTTTGSVGYGAPYGADISIKAINRLGSLDASSDPIDKDRADNPNFGNFGDQRESQGGTHLSGAGSDTAMDNVPDDPLHPDADDR